MMGVQRSQSHTTAALEVRQASASACCHDSLQGRFASALAVEGQLKCVSTKSFCDQMQLSFVFACTSPALIR